ncbi:hypothetical protein [Chondromyces crocatus]|uniref:Uncharacterized protein n=1 Tax=Chondromyces crocatus TaxID=52 RepID=A0A0K1ESA9_CHOCO|nr:hypothetical protein [Chondromyces crocatus]AKT43746.1 uncharacterized protein CMC5_079820 [Chondromyces crocatus]
MYHGYDGLKIERGCPSCSCGPITCMPPSAVAARDQPICTADGPSDDDLHLPIPETWDGACLDVPAVAEADLTLLVASETRLGACKPNLGMVPASDAFAWDFHAMACERKRIPRTCHDGVQWCAPQAEGDFRQCVYTRGDEPTCPAGYSKRRVFFDGIAGSLACSSCTCEAPAVSACEGVLTAFSAPGCDDFVSNVIVNLDEPQCSGQVLPGGLSSLSLSWTLDEPGACTPRGGSPTGRVDAEGPTTFCCL